MNPDTNIHLQGYFSKLYPPTNEEYSKILTLARTEKWEYYTYSPLVYDRTKYVLKGLPTRTELQEIQTALQNKNIHVSHKTDD